MSKQKNIAYNYWKIGRMCILGGFVTVLSSTLANDVISPKSNSIVKEYNSANNALKKLYSIRDHSSKEFWNNYSQDNSSEELSDILNSCYSNISKSIDSAIVVAKTDSAKAHDNNQYSSYVYEQKNADSKTHPFLYAGVFIIVAGMFLKTYGSAKYNDAKK